MTTTKTKSLRARRRALGLSVPELAALAPCSVQMLYNLEQGHVPKRSVALEKVEAALTQQEAAR